MFTIDNQFSNANVARTVRFTYNLFEELNEVAAQNDVSFNMLVLQCCRYALDELSTKKAPDQGAFFLMGVMVCTILM